MFSLSTLQAAASLSPGLGLTVSASPTLEDSMWHSPGHRWREAAGTFQ